MKKKGFTLIELLVVIAIIGLLSSVVLSSINSARGKASDTAIKTSANNIRSQIELFYTNNNTFSGACNDSEILNMLWDLADIAGNSTVCYDIGIVDSSNPFSENNIDGWMLLSPFKSRSVNYCLDYTGSNQETVEATGDTRYNDGECDTYDYIGS